MKPTVCSFTSLFAINYIYELDATTVIPYAADYCSYINDTISNKITIITTLSGLSTTSTTFEDDCAAVLYENSNKWFDPIIPST